MYVHFQMCILGKTLVLETFDFMILLKLHANTLKICIHNLSGRILSCGSGKKVEIKFNLITQQLYKII